MRDTVAPILENFDYVLCAYQRAFGGIANTEYFAALARQLPRMRWVHAECPIFHNNFYLIGARAGAP